MHREPQEIANRSADTHGGLKERGDSGVIWVEASRHPGEGGGEPPSAPVCLA